LQSRDITIRRLRAADAEVYRAIRLEALEREPQAFGSTLEREAGHPIEWFSDRLERGHVMGAFDGGGLLGTAGFFSLDGPKDRHKGVLVGMYVRPDARGRGVGTALVQEILDLAGGLVEQVQLTVVTSNAAARRLYSRLGFEEWGVEPRALKHAGAYFDEVWMVKFLQAG